jgi:GntR family transcriptional regulator
MTDASSALFGSGKLSLPPGGPLYLRLKRYIEEAVARGEIVPGDALPSERDLAANADVSRVTVRKAMQHLVRDGVLLQRHGSGTFVAPRQDRVEQSLSHLTSFTEDMARRGMSVHSQWLDRGIYDPSPQETVALGLSPNARVSRVSRLRLAGHTPLAIERAALSTDTLPDPLRVEGSLYALLEKSGHRPVRAIQRIRAANLDDEDAGLLQISAGAAALHIERIGYLASGKVVEFTRSVYRGDTYDFVAELKVGEGPR